MRSIQMCLLVAIAAMAFVAAPVRAGHQEKVTLAAPVFASAGATEFRVEALYLKRAHPDAQAEIRAIFREVSPTTFTFVVNGRSLVCRYDGAAADTLIVALNKANLSAQSLERRILSRCQTDGKIGAGVIGGSPE